MLMNYLILSRPDFINVPLKKIIHSLYKYHISTYLEENDKIGVGGTSCIIGKIASKGFTVSRLSDDKDKKYLRMMAKEAFMFRCKNLFAEDIIINEINPYIKVSVAFYKYFAMVPYPYYNITLSMILQMIFPEGVPQVRPKQLQKIITDVSSAGEINIDVIQTKTSIIAQMLKGNTVAGANPILKERFSVKEFAAYLYYELLIECIISKISENNG
jgi:hypothetical protein